MRPSYITRWLCQQCSHETKLYNKVVPAMSPWDQAIYQGGSASNVLTRPSCIPRRLCQQCWDYWLLGYQTCDFYNTSHTTSFIVSEWKQHMQKLKHKETDWCLDAQAYTMYGKKPLVWECDQWSGNETSDLEWDQWSGMRLVVYNETSGLGMWSGSETSGPGIDQRSGNETRD